VYLLPVTTIGPIWPFNAIISEGEVIVIKGLHSAVNASAGQNRENIRQHNLSIIMNLLYKGGTLARSQLTSVTGLNRSTISDLVVELEELGIITQSEAVVSGGVGRPSLSVSPSENIVAFSVNPEIDATTVAVVTLSGEIIAKRRYPTKIQPAAQEAAKIAGQLIKDLIKELPSKNRIAGIGVAVPGQIRIDDGVVRLAPHLNWVEAPIAAMVQQETGLPTWVDNDATVSCMAERNFGSGRGASHCVYLFAGSGGIGGGVVVSGVQLRGASGYGSELGHIQIFDSKKTDFSGLPGTLEALVKRDELLEVFKLFGATDDELDVEIANTKDPKAIKLINSQLDNLGRGIGVLATIFNPQIVVLEGFLDSIFKFNKERLLASVHSSSLNSAHDGLVVSSGELGTRAVLIGAAGLAFAPLIANPSGTEIYKLSKVSA
jgi:predicted NBD/HSP70 family sugar kinase